MVIFDPRSAQWMTGPVLDRLCCFILALFCCLLLIPVADAQPVSATIDQSAVAKIHAVKPAAAAVDADKIKSQLKMSPSTLANRNVRLIKNSGTLKLDATNIDSAIKPNSLLVERTGSAVSQATVGSKTAWQLPMQFSYIRGDGSVFSFEPFIEVIRPMLYQHEESTFKAILGLGVMDRSRPASREKLADPVSFTITGAADITPHQITVKHLSQPFQEIELRMNNPAAEVAVGVIATLDSEMNSVAIPTLRPKLKLRISPSSSIDGFGLATAVVHVSAEQGGIFEGQKIALASTVGRLENSSVTLDASGSAETQIRSSFIGPAAVTAQAYPFDESTKSVQFAWPVAFSIIAVIGALLGAVARRYRKHSSFIVSVIFGFLGALLGAVGVNFLGLPVEIPAGEAFILIVTIFAAYMGPAAFKGAVPAMDAK